MLLGIYTTSSLDTVLIRFRDISEKSSPAFLPRTEIINISSLIYFAMQSVTTASTLVPFRCSGIIIPVIYIPIFFVKSYTTYAMFVENSGHLKSEGSNT